jgi:transposase-like protein
MFYNPTYNTYQMKCTINQQKLEFIAQMAINNYTNDQMAKELNIKKGTLLYWKKKLRDQGIHIPEYAVKNTIFVPQISTTKETFDNMSETDQAQLIKQNLAKLMDTPPSTLDTPPSPIV